MSEDGPGTKRPRTSDESGTTPQAGDPEYLKQLQAEKEKLEASESELPHSLRLLLAEIERVTTGGSEIAKTSSSSHPKASGLTLPWEKPDDGSGIRAVLLPDATGGKASMKVFVPTTSIDARKGSSRGLLLGTGGNTLRTLQTESKCKLTIKGKGSNKNVQEVAPGTDAEEEDLHVLVEYDGPAHSRDQAFIYVEKMIRTILSGCGITPMTMPYVPYSTYSVPGPAANYEAEQAYVNSAVAAGQIVSVMASHWDNGATCKSAIKVYVPPKTAVGDSRGKILGTKGSSLRQIQNECGCKLSLRGKGSCKIPDGETEDSVATSNPAQYGHLKVSSVQEGLHVLVEFEGPAMHKDAALQHAESLIRATLTPAADAAAGFPQTQFEVMMQQKQAQASQAYGAPHMYPGMDSYGQGAYRPPPAPAPPPQWGQPYGPPPPAPYPSYAPGYY